MMVAFTKFYMYQGGIESAIFCWDYSNPKVSLGIAIQTKEVEFAREQGMEYLYLGPGYEVSSIYKSRFPGFEWWTGKEWCTDIPQYVQLCQRDTEMKQHIHFDKIDPTVFDPDYKELDLTATP
jgi:arginyl-tRNA--protein-N-Asp/Glu arginylyltransferase